MSSAKSEQGTIFQAVIPGGSLPPLAQEVINEAAQLGPFEVYINHSLIVRKLIAGFSPSYDTARSYAFRSLQTHPEIVKKKPKELEVKVEKNTDTELFWCYVITKEYFSLLTQVTVPLDTEDTYETSYWDDENLATIEIASTLEEAVEKVNQRSPSKKNKLVKSSHEGQHNILRNQDFVAAIHRTPTDFYRQVALYSLLLK
ncbi:MAG TPA: hypothetical protein VF209_03925 [Patescibacteria group bacterium]